MPILGLCVDAFRAACSYNIDSQPLGLKSDRKEGGFWGLKFKIEVFTFSQDKLIIDIH
jgi:hypothetical protein